MAEMTAKHRLGCVIEELTLVGIVYNTKALQYQIWTGGKELVGDCDEHGHVDVPTEFGTEADLAQATAELEKLQRQRADCDQWHAAGKDVALLTQIFSNLAANTKLHGLVSLTTDVAVFRQTSRTRQPASERPGLRLVWQAAARTFHTLMLSLTGTHLSLRHLNLFHNAFSGHCSLECNELSFYDWETDGLAQTLAILESLSISISDRILHETQHDRTATGDPVELITSDEFEDLHPNLEDLRRQAGEEENYNGLNILLNSSKQLQQLNLRRCFIRRRQHELHSREGHSFIQRIAAEAYLPTLQTCNLENFTVLEQDLLVLLNHSALRSLKLRRIGLTQGTWNNILEHCTQNQTLHFEDLYQVHQAILFDDGHREARSNCVVEGLNKGQNICKRASGQPKAIIWYIPQHQRLRVDQCVNRRSKERRDFFGPPVSHYPGLHH